MYKLNISAILNLHVLRKHYCISVNKLHFKSKMELLEISSLRDSSSSSETIGGKSRGILGNDGAPYYGGFSKSIQAFSKISQNY